MSDENALLLRLRKDVANPNLMWVKDVVVKSGPRAWKTAAVLCIGDKTTGEVKKLSFVVQTWEKKAIGGYAFEKKADYRWSCEDDEMSRIQALLNENLPHTGRFRMVEEESSAALVDRLTRGDASSAVSLMVELLDMPDVRDVLSMSDAVAAGSALVLAQRQRTALVILQKAVDDPEGTEQSLQSALDNQWWLFGGRYIGQHRRRSLTAMDQLDIPLLRSDGSLHIVELKRANIPKLVERYRNHLIVGSEVHAAVSQAMNYLRAMDEQSAIISQSMNVDVRRATATVVIGHPQFSKGGWTEQDATANAQRVSETLRTYNSHLARVEVITYADLIEGATAALQLAEDLRNTETDPEAERGNDLPGPDPASNGEEAPF